MSLIRLKDKNKVEVLRVLKSLSLYLKDIKREINKTSLK